LLVAESYDGLVFPLHEVTIGSPVETRIEALSVREGAEVKQGQVLVELYAQRQELEARRGAAAVEKRVFEAKSAENLYADKLISEDEVREARVELDLARLTHAMAEEQVDLRRLRAPIAGVVVERLRDAGEMVQMSEPILVLVDLRQVYVQFYVRAESLSDLSVGQPAEARFPSLGLEAPAVGRVDFIDPRVDAASGLLRVRVLIDNPEGQIKAGVRAQVRLLEVGEED
jgi:RND family efflux transporter MFP subunit